MTNDRVYRPIRKNHNFGNFIPALLSSIAYKHIYDVPGDASEYEIMLNITKETINQCFAGITREKKESLSRRLERIGKAIMRYFNKNDFDTCKMFLAITEWVKLLLDYELLIVFEDRPFATLLKDLDALISEGEKHMEGFEKKNRSAINHVLSIHDIAVKEGYFN